ncbi:MAG TPA: hypothetical protein VFH33_05380 [Candidatus Krumholzibacteria bacterium]|nr:hypothetical protein [Candidatus Krumholzibacteria bacterium]
MESPTFAQPQPTRRRLSGQIERRGTRTGMSVGGAFLFGLVFVGAGAGITLLGLRIIPVDPSSVHAPWWVIQMCGVCFAGGGVAVWGMASTQLGEDRRRHAAARRYAGSHAMLDHAWDVRGYSPPRWKRAVQMTMMAGFMSLFFSIFNWIAWFARAPFLFKIVAVPFDLILLLVWWKAGVEVARAIRFGNSRVTFDHFPFRVSDTVSVGWIPPLGIASALKGSFTLRCVEEYYEERGSGDDRSRWLVHDELSAEVQSFDAPQSFTAGRAVELRFTPAANAVPTRFAGDRPIFWELEVKLARNGLDFEERYLIPIY